MATSHVLVGVGHVEVRRDVKPQAYKPDASADLGVTMGALLADVRASLSHPCRLC
jgi:hypothetical protein